ncbi:hypothetical protein ACOJQI_02390 [Bacillus salacetis]|uniref:hypothetical protein n=1 Tax=Bacillus salacetis TaxID=2315464 RepID=UPI003B9DC8CC
MYKACMMMVLLLLLSGCRIEMDLNGVSSPQPIAGLQEQSASAKNTFRRDEPLGVYLNGDVVYRENRITLKLETALPKGTILNIILREYPKDASLRGIADGSVQPVETPVYEGTVEAQSQNINLPVKRNPEQIYDLSVEFRPEIQTDELKEVYGERGEKIVIARNLNRYEYEGRTMIGVEASSYIGFPPGSGWLE